MADFSALFTFDSLTRRLTAESDNTLQEITAGDWWKIDETYGLLSLLIKSWHYDQAFHFLRYCFWGTYSNSEAALNLKLLQFILKDFPGAVDKKGRLQNRSFTKTPAFCSSCRNLIQADSRDMMQLSIQLEALLCFKNNQNKLGFFFFFKQAQVMVPYDVFTPHCSHT